MTFVLMKLIGAWNDFLTLTFHPASYPFWTLMSSCPCDRD
jgi:hypothetical protein